MQPRYFSAKSSDEHDKGKTSTKQQQPTNEQKISQHNPSSIKLKPNQNIAAQQEHGETPPATGSSQTQAQPENQQSNAYQTQKQHSNKPQNGATPEAPTQSQTFTPNQNTNVQQRVQNLNSLNSLKIRIQLK
jgi:hypothetical protein